MIKFGKTFTAGGKSFSFADHETSCHDFGCIALSIDIISIPLFICA
jgi:hypothetical protein